MNYLLRTLATAVSFLNFVLAIHGVALADDIKVGGGAGPVKNVLQPVKEAFEKSSGHRLHILETGGTGAFKDLMRGSLDMASAGFSFDELLQSLKSEGTEVNDKDKYQSVVVAKAEIQVFVNKDNPVAKLSKEQLQGLFSGKIANWKEVGGNDLPVIVSLAGLNPATNTTFQKQILDGGAYAKERGDVSTTDDLKSFIGGTIESIGFGPATMGGGQLKKIEAPEISREIIFITKGAPSSKVQKLLDFVRGDGQKLIKK